MLDARPGPEPPPAGLVREAGGRAAEGDPLPPEARPDPGQGGGDVDETQEGVDYLRLASSCFTVAASGALGASLRKVSKSATILSGCFFA